MFMYMIVYEQHDGNKVKVVCMARCIDEATAKVRHNDAEFSKVLRSRKGEENDVFFMD